MENLVIIGAGPAGYTAALYAARANLAPVLIAGETPGGLLTQTTEVENFPGFPNGVMGPDLMFQMQEQAEKFGAKIEYELVVCIEPTDGNIQTIHLSNGRSICCRALIIATGATPRQLGIAAEAKFKNHGVSACATCDGAFYQNQPVAVVGGGDSAMEEALFLTRFASKVYVIHRREALRASKVMASRALDNTKIEFIWNSTVTDMSGEKELESLTLYDSVAKKSITLECSACFVALGHEPNTALIKPFIECDTNGYIVLRGNSSATNCRGIFAAGDCADPHYRQAITASGMGCRAAIDAERYLGNIDF